MALLGTGCALKTKAPPAGIVAHAARLPSYSASLSVSVRGESMRGRSRALVAFQRPDAVRIEIPGPSGARLLAVLRQGRLVAVLPGARAVLEADATRPGLASLLGIPLTPEQLIDLLVGQPPADARECRVGWGETLPRRIDAVLADGTRLKVTIEDAQGDVRLPTAAFEPPPHPGYRPVDADEARQLLGGR